MSDELFPASEVASDSPKLRWMRAHKIKSQDRGEEANPRMRWTAYHADTCHRTYAPDEDSALIDLAEMLDIADWREETL